MQGDDENLEWYDATNNISIIIPVCIAYKTLVVDNWWITVQNHFGRLAAFHSKSARIKIFGR